MRLLFGVLTLFVCAPSVANAQALARIHEQFALEPPHGFESFNPTAINNRGEIVGTATGNPQEEDGSAAFFWSAETGYRRLFDREADEDSSWASDISDAGLVVGSRHQYSYDYEWRRIRGYVWNARTGTEAGPDAHDFILSAINERGEIAGQCWMSGAACLMRGGQMVRMNRKRKGQYDYGSGALAINRRGDVVGWGSQDGTISRGWLWRPNHRLIDLGVGTPSAISDRGIVVINRPSGLHAWKLGQDVPFPLDATAVGTSINTADAIVGRLGANGFVWHAPDGAILLLQSSFGRATAATDINDHGVVVGTERTPTGTRVLVWQVPHPRLRVDTPNEFSEWGIGTRQRIAWTYRGSAGQFQIDISRDAGNSWELLAVVPNKPGPSQNFYWTVAGPAASATRIRVSAAGGATDTSDSALRITQPKLSILRPSGGTSAHVGDPYTIFFTHNLGTGRRVAIEVSRDAGGTWQLLTSARTKGPTTSSHRWIVDAPVGARPQIRVRSLEGGGVVDISAPLTIKPRRREIQAGWFDEYGHDDGPAWQLNAPGLTATGWWEPLTTCWFNIGACYEGETFDYDLEIRTTTTGVLTIDGIEYEAGSARLSLRAEAVVVGAGMVSAPFTVTGVITALGSDGKTVVASAAITATGTMRVVFERADEEEGPELYAVAPMFEIGALEATVTADGIAEP